MALDVLSSAKINEYIVNARKENGKVFTTDSKADIPHVGADCPYGYLSKDGIISYNGVNFVCDEEKNCITLGDVSREKDTITVALSGGGSLKFNVNNIDELRKALGMFSPEDVNRILRAISTYNHCTSKLQEIDGEEEEFAKKTIDEINGLSYMQEISAYKRELIEKIKNGETEPKYQIGATEMTEKEWDKMLSTFDKAEDVIKDSVKEEIENLSKKRELSKEQLDRLCE